MEAKYMKIFNDIADKISKGKNFYLVKMIKFGE